MTGTWGFLSDTRSKVQQAELGSFELGEVIIAGVKARFNNKAEQFRTLLAVAIDFRRSSGAGLDYAAEHLEQHVKNHKTECLGAGVCPHCGEDVTLEKRPEFHNTPFRDITVVERWQVYLCGHCGEV